MEMIKEIGITGFIIRILLIILVASMCFYFLSRIGIPPITAAIVFIFFGKLLKAIFKLICYIVSAGLLIYLLSLIL